MPVAEITVQGKCKWAHTKRPNQFGDYAIDLYPDEPSLAKIKDLIVEGIKNQLKKDDDGYYIRFKRAVEKTDRQGRRFSLGAPVVMDRDRRVFDDFIGNGSDVTLLLEVYGGNAPGGVGKYKAARLKGVRVETLVPFTDRSIEDEREQGKASRLADTPLQNPNW